MNLNKAELIQSLQKKRKSFRTKDSTIMESNEVLETVRSSVPKSEKSDIASDIKEAFNKTLTENAILEKEWRPQKSSMKQIMDRVLIEANQQANPNAMRLNLQSMVLDKTHGKFSVTRNGVEALVELMYPNVNDKITLKVSVKGADDSLVEIGLEDQPYLTDFGAYILKLVDETIANSVENTEGLSNTQMYLGNKSGGLTGNSPIWESDSHRIQSLMTLVEQEEELEEETEVEGEEFDSPEGAVDEFTEGDFAIDAGAPVDTGDFTADFGGGFGDTEAAGDVNADNEGEVSGEVDDTEWSTFRDKTDWLQSSLDSMQKLTSNSIAQKMQQGTGVVLTSDELLNGTVGLKNDMPVDVVDKFLNVYPELDNIELKESDLEQIEEKLSLDDGQFDSWLQQKLPEITGQDEVSTTLDNDMFDDFSAMGGEETIEEATPEASFEQFLDDVSVDTEKTPDEIEAESEVDISELPELPNL